MAVNKEDSALEKTKQDATKQSATLLYSASMSKPAGQNTNPSVQQPSSSATAASTAAANASAVIPSAKPVLAAQDTLANKTATDTVSGATTVNKIETDSKYKTIDEIRTFIKNEIQALKQGGMDSLEHRLNILNQPLNIGRDIHYTFYTCLSWAVNCDYQLAIELIKMGVDQDGKYNIDFCEIASRTHRYSIPAVKQKPNYLVHGPKTINPLYATMSCFTRYPHVTTDNERANLARILIQSGANITIAFYESSRNEYFPGTLFDGILNNLTKGKELSEPKKVLLAALYKKHIINKDDQVKNFIGMEHMSFQAAVGNKQVTSDNKLPAIGPWKIFSDVEITILVNFGKKYYDEGILDIKENMQASNAASVSDKPKASSSGQPALK